MSEKVAVIGSGVSGLTAAYLLRQAYDVTVFEVDDRTGGHAHTHEVGVPAGDSRQTVDPAGGSRQTVHPAGGSRQTVDKVDSGFIVHNDRTYPFLRRLFAELDVAVHPTEMSMSIHCDGCGLEYAGGRGGAGLFAQRRRLLSPRYLRMLLAVKRFQKLALALLDEPEGGRHSADEPTTYGDFLRLHGFDDYFVDHYAIPVVSCVWSSGHETALEYPARYLFAFLRHHGFLSIKGSPQWFTVEGGSHAYVDKVVEAIGDVRVARGITAVTRKPDHVELIDSTGKRHVVDKVVVATHADQALGLLTDPTDDERAVLGAFSYSHNETVLHTDPSLLPVAPQARSSWNYRMDACHQREESTSVTYWMNRLQGIDENRPYLVTLNSTDRIAPASVVATMQYTHPIYTPASVAAQARLAGLATDRVVYAGAYHGWGFHEDGCRSGVEAAAALGVTW